MYKIVPFKTGNKRTLTVAKRNVNKKTSKRYKNLPNNTTKKGYSNNSNNNNKNQNNNMKTTSLSSSTSLLL